MNNLIMLMRAGGDTRWGGLRPCAEAQDGERHEGDGAEAQHEEQGAAREGAAGAGSI